MKIESKIKRPNGTVVALGGTQYEFKPDKLDRHVCDVTNKEHIERFLAVPEGFRLLDDEKAGSKQEAPKGVTQDNAAPDNAKTVTPEGGDDEGEGEGSDEGEDGEDSRDALVEQFEKRFGRKPHGKWTAERIRAELEQ